MTTRVISIRVPAQWQGRITSDQVRDCVLAWLREPVLLFEDPGPGSYKLNIRFSLSELAALKRTALRRSTSATIRGITALHLSAATPETRGFKWQKSGIGISLVLLSLFLRFVGGGSAVGQQKGQNT
jgi:hypothetical protein